MQIGSVTEITPSTLEYSSSQRQSKTAAPSSTTTAAHPSPITSSKTTSSANLPSSTNSHATNALAASYLTTVAGKNYGGTVEESGGSYTASVPLPPGARASGPTIEIAENNLNIILDMLA
jgi:hypothetical protein